MTLCDLRAFLFEQILTNESSGFVPFIHSVWMFPDNNVCVNEATITHEPVCPTHQSDVSLVCLLRGCVVVVGGWWKESRLCLLDLRPADVSCLIVQNLNRSSSCGPAGACNSHDFHVLPIILLCPDPLCTCDRSQLTATCSVQCCRWILLHNRTISV